MPVIKKYGPRVTIRWSTPNPEQHVQWACSTTQKGIMAEGSGSNEALVRYLYEADHGSPLEHAVICLNIDEISRACADQIRTHRMASHTMSSTHYQDHSDYPHLVDERSLTPVFEQWTEKAINHAMLTYSQVLKLGMNKEGARQFLPLSTAVGYVLTINARSLANFLELRLCRRNTIETILLARRIHEVVKIWFPELFAYVGPDCETHKGCKQGSMKCKYIQVEQRIAKYE